MQEFFNKATLDKQAWLGSLEKLPWQTIRARLPQWLSLILVILIAKAAAEMSWLIFTPVEEHQTVSGNNRQLATTQFSQPGLKSVVSLHLFGEAQQLATKPVDAPIEAPKTSLKLVLRGVFSHSDPDKAMAIIADASGKEKLYRIGGQVPGGATVHTIYPDRVILQRNGQFETLQLPRDELPNNAVVMRQAVMASRPSRERSVQAPDKLKQMREMIKTNPQEIWKQVRIEPVLAEGRIKGYRLFHKDAQLMRALGINRNDVITEVNGMSLDDPAALYELMGQIDTATDIRLTVERNGNTEVLVVHM